MEDQEGVFKPMWLYPQILQGDPPERWGHSGCYSDGKLYIYGGCSGGLHFSDVLMLDLKNMSCKTLPTSGEDPGVCDSHTSVIHEGKMIVFGGTNGTLKRNDLHILDLETLVWIRPTVQGHVPAPRESHTATLINNTQMLIFGGSGHGEKSYLNDVHIFDIEKFEWTCPDIKGNLPAWRDSHTAVVVGKQLIVYGGDCGDRYLGDLDVLDLETFTWSKMSLPSSARPGVRAGHTAVVVEKKMFVFGGVGDRTYYNDLWALDIENRAWCQLGVDDSHPQGRFSHIAVLAEDNVLIYGGCGEDERPLNEFLVLHISNKRNQSVWKFLGSDYDLQKMKIGQEQQKGGVSRRAGTTIFSKSFLETNQEDITKLMLNQPTKRRKFSQESKDNGSKPKQQKLRKDDDILRPTLQLQVHIPSHLESPTVNYKPCVSGSLVGSELHGTVDGVFDSGYLMTAQLNGQLLRGVLFSPGLPAPALGNMLSSRRVQSLAQLAGKQEEENLSLSLSI